MVDHRQEEWQYGIPGVETPRISAMSRRKEEVPTPPIRNRPRLPLLPDSNHLLRFWLAGPLTLLIFVPALGAGIFGAPLMLPGTYCAYRMLRAGHDKASDFALAGFILAFLALLAVMLVAPDFMALYAFGLFFGPLMAMTFRWIAGSWREAVTPTAVSYPASMPPLAHASRTQ